MQCPLWWALQYEWTPRRLNGPRDYARVLGRAFTAGMASAHQWQQTAPTSTLIPPGVVDEAVAVATTLAQAGLAELAGFEVSDRDAAMRDAVVPRAQRAVRKAIEQSPIPPEWFSPEMLVEADLGEAYGHAKPDLAVVTPRGYSIVDYKLKLAVRGRSPEERDRNRQFLIQDYEYSWQMYHYCWALSGVTGGEVTTYNIALVTLEPKFQMELLPYEINPESMAMWLGFAERAWADMEAIEMGERDPYTFMPCRSQYGMCDCNLAVWKHHLDPTLMEQDYVRRKHGQR